jgi:hypothetical protein
MNHGVQRKAFLTTANTAGTAKDQNKPNWGFAGFRFALRCVRRTWGNAEQIVIPLPAGIQFPDLPGFPPARE